LNGGISTTSGADNPSYRGLTVTGR
jgi:hypothetical protein